MIMTTSSLLSNKDDVENIKITTDKKIETFMTTQIIKIMFRAKTTGLHHEIRELQDNWSCITDSQHRNSGSLTKFTTFLWMSFCRHDKTRKNINGAIQINGEIFSLQLSCFTLE